MLLSTRLRGLIIAALFLASELLVLLGNSAAIAVQTATAAALGVVLVKGSRREHALRKTWLLLLAAIATGLVAALIRLVWQLTAGSLPSNVWQADVVALLWVPLVVAAFVVIPTDQQRGGSRTRAFADGLLAASSLWYILYGFKLAEALANAHTGLAHRSLLLGTPIGDVFVLATALATYARCASSTRRIVGWALAGLTGIAVGDLMYAVPRDGGVVPPSSVAGLFNELGLFLLVVGTVSSLRERPDSPRQLPSRSISGSLPFVPLVFSMILTTRDVIGGEGMRKDQLLPALCVAVALLIRQVVSSRDQHRTLMELAHSKQAVEAELRIDALTGLGNRTCLTDDLAAALCDPARWPVVVALLDLNDFKVINDNHGHDTGDALLVEISSRLRGCVRDGDTVARLGGDEFAVVATNVQDEGAALGARLRRAFDEPFALRARQFTVRASIGVVNGQEGQNPPDVLACADVAMYQAKEQRSPTSVVRVLTTDGHLAARRRLQIQEAVVTPDLRQFRVVYQPVVALASGDIRGVEALLRWDHPELGSVPPDQFIPLAELAGSITILGDFVLSTAITDLAAMQAQCPDRRLAVGVNVAPRQLIDPEFVLRALAQLRSYNLEPDQLVLEITEQAFEANLEAVAENLRGFAEAGVSIAVDDFGTGYSSLRYLQLLPVEIMKIDKTFVNEIASEPRACKLVSSITAMASVLDLQLVAEGIETEDQLRILQGLNCELGQGYLFSRPLDRAALEALLRAGQAYRVVTVPSPREEPAQRWAFSRSTDREVSG